MGSELIIMVVGSFVFIVDNNNSGKALFIEVRKNPRVFLGG